MKYPNWVLCYGRDIVDRAFPAGISEDGEAVLVGRFIVEDALTPGIIRFNEHQFKQLLIIFLLLNRKSQGFHGKVLRSIRW